MFESLTSGEWIPAISMSTILAVLGFLAGTYYKAKVERTVQHNLDRELETLKQRICQDEGRLNAKLHARDAEITALRSGALAGLASRHAALDKRRLEAIEQLWTAVVEHAHLKMVSKMVASIKMENALGAAAAQNEDGRKLREFAETIWKVGGIDNFKPQSAPDKARPFLSPIAWALFSAYRQMLSLPVAQLAAMRTGMGNVLSDPKPMTDLVKSALPHRSSLVDEYGTTAFAYLIDELEEKILGQLIVSLDGEPFDEKSVRQAAEILKAVDKVASAEHKIDIPNVDGIRA